MYASKYAKYYLVCHWWIIDMLMLHIFYNMLFKNSAVMFFGFFFPIDLGACRLWLIFNWCLPVQLVNMTNACMLSPERNMGRVCRFAFRNRCLGTLSCRTPREGVRGPLLGVHSKALASGRIWTSSVSPSRQRTFKCHCANLHFHQHWVLCCSIYSPKLALFKISIGAIVANLMGLKVASPWLLH